MKEGYLVLASERRVLNVTFNNELDAIQQVLGCMAIEHGTTLHTEDQLLINGDELNGAPTDRFWVAGVPFAFVGSGLLVGIDPSTGDTANQPVMAIDEFRRLVTFAASEKGWHRPSVSLVALGGDDVRGGCDHAREQTQPEHTDRSHTCAVEPASISED
jgi:hypothetical protein